MEQTYVVAGYFASRTAARRAMNLLGSRSFHHRLYAFGDTGIARPLERLALAWLQPNEHLLAITCAEGDVEQFVEALQRSGEATYVAWLPPDLVAEYQMATPAPLRQRWLRSLAVVQEVLERQLQQTNPEEFQRQRAKWGIAEAAYEDNLAGISLIGHQYIIEGYIEQLSPFIKDSRNLRRLSQAALEDVSVPAVYNLARQAEQALRGRLNENRLRRWLRPRCRELDLTRVEYKAIRPMLLVALFEDLARQLIAGRLREGEIRMTRIAAERLRELPPGDVAEYLDWLGRIWPQPPAAFSARLLELTRDAPAVQPGLAKLWGLTTGEVLERILTRQQHRDAEQIEHFNRLVTSLRELVHTDWETLLEDISPVVAKLRQDPSGHFSRMDAPTRSLYLGRIADLSRWSKQPERAIATAAVGRAASAAGVARHVGYYLVDDGLAGFQRSVRSRPPLWIRLSQHAQRHPSVWYLGLLGGLWSGLFLFWVLIIVSFAPGLSLLLWSFWLAGGALALSQVAWEGSMYVLVRLIRPRQLPKLRFPRALPAEYQTTIVIPLFLRNHETLPETIRNLEARYLANPDTGLTFGLLTAFPDAAAEELTTDKPLLEQAVASLKELQQRHPRAHFFLYHRPRTHNANEGVWMEAERKRGKLEEFNELLLGRGHVGRLLVGDINRLRATRFVITLDEDTELPPGTAKRMVEALAHPLNEPQIDARGRRLLRGYGIIQPRVITDLEVGRASRLAMLLNGRLGIDPYLVTYSDLYFDLAGDAIFHGKGIYDPRTFDTILGGRLPDNRILSHDLLEGSYMRVALATDIILFDSFPTTHRGLFSRQHRWVRGDWQIASWLGRSVPAAGGRREANPFSALSRWKIADNLRRSLLPAAITGLIVMALLARGPLGQAGLALALIAAFMPLLVQLLDAFRGLLRLRLPNAKDLAVTFSGDLYRLLISPRMAWANLDAIIRVAYRLNISRRRLLQWVTADDLGRIGGRNFDLAAIILASAALGAFLVISERPLVGVLVPLGILGLWVLAPLVMVWLDRPGWRRRGPAAPAEADRRMLWRVGLQTWRFFDEQMTEANNYLPPDNLQVTLKVEVARQTSPTNIGLGLLAWLAARDLGAIGADQLLDRTERTINSLSRLETYRGHIYNWYRTDTLEPLGARYISMVDSGNLLGALWTFRQGLLEQISAPLIAPAVAVSWRELLAELRIRVPQLPEALADELSSLVETLYADREDPLLLLKSLDDLVAVICARESELRAVGPNALVERFINQAFAWNDFIERYLSWKLLLADPPAEVERLFSAEFRAQCRRWTRQMPSLSDLADQDREPLALAGEARPVISWWDTIEHRRRLAVEAAHQAISRLEQLAAQTGQLADRIDMKFLYNAKRKVFHIGYNLEESGFDRSFYDLLASEARLGSFAAVAAGQIPAEHWWALGRNSRRCDNQPVLLSWNGTMFEYFMPRLFMRTYPGTLLQQCLEGAVALQKRYARLLEIPWGISESGHSALDYDNTYQYRAFGVPALGIQSGLEQGIVVSPYASLLALAVDPAGAVTNLRALERQGLRGELGFFEAVDFRRAATTSGERGVGVFSYMAHHQAMGLLAITNYLQNEPFPRRFHRDLRVQAARTLLHERAIVPTRSRQDTSLRDVQPLQPLSAPAVAASTFSLTDPLPQAHLLTNGRYTVMVTATGGGFSRWGEVEINRWSIDTLRHEKGSYIYLSDGAGAPWSTTYEPTLRDDETYRVSFMPEKAVFERTHQDILSHEEIFVATDHDVEVRHLQLHNQGHGPRQVDVTSVVEFALSPHAAHIGHPAFDKMFIDIEVIPEQDGIIARRRPRAAGEVPVWTAHLLVNLSRPASRATFETDRERFLSRRSTPQQPVGLNRLDEDLVEYPLDPIAAVMQRVSLVPGEQLELAALTIAASTRDEVIRQANRYRQRAILRRTRQVAWTLRQAELQRLQITEAESRVFNALAPYLIYPNHYLRSAAVGLVASGGRTGLVGFDDLPDAPCMVAAIDDLSDIILARQLGLAQKYYQVRGLHFPLVLLIRLTGEAGRRLIRQVTDMAEGLNWLGEAEPKVDIRIWPLEHIGPEVLEALLDRARIVLDGSDGPLSQQLRAVPPLTRGIGRPALQLAAPQPLQLPDRGEFSNGLGLFTDDGHRYVTHVSPRSITPVPWANVLSNAHFGALITERGGGFTWYENSQQYRLTTWQNDPLLDEPHETIYVQDLDTNRVWSPQPGFHSEGEALVSHEPGQTLFQGKYDDIAYNLVAFVPVGWHGPSNVKIQRLRLINQGQRPCRLRLTLANELVLGPHRELSQEHVATWWNDTEQLILAQNTIHQDYSHMVAFVGQNLRVTDFTTDRTEFLGPVHGDELPHGLGAPDLSGRIGRGLDTIAVMRSDVELAPGAEIELDTFIGSASSPAAAVAAARALRQAGNVSQALSTTTAWWQDTISAITVESPAREADILLNTWLPYQALSSRIWGRTGYYQSSGAFGFRDQLQDSLAVMYSRPEITRSLIIQAAEHQFEEGDVQHWWMPGTNRGIRTRMTDDRLWLPYVTVRYITATGDQSILDEQIPYLTGAPLAEDQAERYADESFSQRQESLLEHCLRAVNISLTQGSHGLPLMGAGDWNDGLNRVGLEGRGESVWLAWFQVVVLRDMAGLLDRIKRKPALARRYREWSEHYTAAIEKTAWDGDWYRRAFYDDGDTMGSAKDQEDQIDSLPQSWAVIAGTGSPQRRERAMQAALGRLVDRRDGIVRLLTPAFDHTPKDPGYIKGYLPGLRENGGQYTHASLWLAQALARMGRGADAIELLRLMNPINHTTDPQSLERYRLEPYVVAADVYDLHGQEGRGGWSWYTGSAGWMYRVWLEEVFGFKLQGRHLEINPCIDRNWPGFKLTYRYGKSQYIINVTNPHHVGHGVAEQRLDGRLQPRGPIPLTDDGQVHHLDIRLGP